MKVKNLIVGAGPTGLSAAWRLEELGETDWLLIEQTPEAGGLAGSVIDEKGYTWDQGGHVQFSHYDYFDDLMDSLLEPHEWLHHERESWVWVEGGFVPYPFQNNLRYLPREAMWECIKSLIELIRNPSSSKPKNFGEWTKQIFGKGICRIFMEPYNFKVWAYPLEELACDWIGDRVSVVALERVLDNILHERDDISWGPNNTFRFPLRGGTGEVWRRLAARLPKERLKFGSRLLNAQTKTKTVKIDGMDEPIEYENLISTIPLDKFVALSDLADEPDFIEHAGLLRYSSTHIIGVGIKGKPEPHVETKCWMYFPEADNPFYRATVFSNYSPNNVPDIEKGWSLMCEVSESPEKPVDIKKVVESTVAGVLATKLVKSRDDIVHTWHRRLNYGYPTPSIHRDRAVDFLLPKLEERNVFSRGRFGAWKYEVSNQDHSVMQGVECVDHIVNGAEEITFSQPEVVNAPRKKKS